MHLNAIALEAEEGKETLVVLSRGGRLDTLQDGKRDIWPSASTADRNERGSRSGSEFRSLCSEWNRDRGNGRASTHFTMARDGVIRGDQTDAVYYEMTTISRGLDGFSSIDRFSSRR